MPTIRQLPTVQTFMRQIRQLTEETIYYNRSLVRGMNVPEYCFEKSKECLGKDYNFLHDAAGVRIYLRDVFGREYYRYFEDMDGYVELDIPHALVFLHKLKADNSPLYQAGLGIFYFIAGHTLSEEFEGLHKVAIRDHINPSFIEEPYQFQWRRCPQVTNAYMLPFTTPEGYDTYYFDKVGLNQISYLHHLGVDYNVATEQVAKMNTGLFYTFLPAHVEDMLMPYIASGRFDPMEMDGYYVQTLLRDKAKIAEEYPLGETHNVYNNEIKPRNISHTGKIIKGVLDDLQRNTMLMR